VKRFPARWKLPRAGTVEPELTFRQWWWLPFAWILVGLLFSLQPLLWGDPAWTGLVQFEALRSWPWLLLAPMVVALSLRLPLIGPHWRPALAIHLFASIVMVLGLEQITRLSPPRGPRMFEARMTRFENRNQAPGDYGPRPPFLYQRPAKPEADMGQAPSKPGGPMASGFDLPRPPLWSMRLRLTLPLYWSLVALAHLQLFHFRTRRAARTETQLAEARLAVLQMQLQPHFLFNSLNAISSLVRTQPEVADNMICALGTLLRTALGTQGRREITLEEELKLARHYLRIQQVRFGTQLTIIEEISEDALGVAVPPLILQPLLENAVTHGLAHRAGTITLRALAQEGRLIVTVSDRRAENEGPRATPKPGSGIGLSNTRARLEALYGEQASVAFQADGDRRETKVCLPCAASPSPNAATAAATSSS